MGPIANIRVLGSQLIATDTNGNTEQFIASIGGLWVPTTAPSGTTQGAGESSSNSPGTNTTPPGSVSAAVDDYPWPHADEDAMSPLRYSYRDCTDFVAWRINRDDGCTAAPWKWTWGNLRWQGPGGDGDAIGWRPDWHSYGRGIDLAPAAGRIAWFSSEVGQYGHVAYVQAYDGTNVHLEEYNWGDTQNYGTRTIPASQVDSYLAIP